MSKKRERLEDHGPDGFSAGGKHSAWCSFVRQLRQHGRNVTHSRRLVFERLYGRRGDFTAEHVVDELTARGPERVCRATVFGTMRLMVEGGYLRRYWGVDGRPRYESSAGAPLHALLRCRRCGQVMESMSARLPPSLRVLCRPQGFVPEHAELSLTGVCRVCRVEASEMTEDTADSGFQSV